MKLLKFLFILLSGLISALYLANIGVGVFELIPDNLPGVGNLDEFAASLVLINCLAYFGYDLRRKPQNKTQPTTIDV